MAKYVVWKSNENGKWYWHLYSDKNGRTVCYAADYDSKQAAKDSIAWVKTNVNAPIEEDD